MGAEKTKAAVPSRTPADKEEKTEVPETDHHKKDKTGVEATEIPDSSVHHPKE